MEYTVSRKLGMSKTCPWSDTKSLKKHVSGQSLLLRRDSHEEAEPGQVERAGINKKILGHLEESREPNLDQDPGPS